MSELAYEIVGLKFSVRSTIVPGNSTNSHVEVYYLDVSASYHYKDLRNQDQYGFSTLSVCPEGLGQLTYTVDNSELSAVVDDSSFVNKFITEQRIDYSNPASLPTIDRILKDLDPLIKEDIQSHLYKESMDHYLNSILTHYELSGDPRVSV